MVRWEPDARGRRGQAAFELVTERGFEQVTVAEIAERAGLAERTFFRCFADKRGYCSPARTGSRSSLCPASVAPPVAPCRSTPSPGPCTPPPPCSRRTPAASGDAPPSSPTPDLRERELIKLATVAAASLAAEAGLAVFRIAFARWIAAPDGPDLAQLISDSLDELTAVTGGT